MTGGKEAFYRKVLALFRKDAEERLSLLQTVPGTDALPTFVTHVHALKGASASIGATEVSEHAAKLEAAGKSGDLAYIKDNLPRFTERLTQLVENIHTLLQLNETAVPVPSTSRSPLLSELETALKSGNVVEIDRVINELNQKPLDPKTKKALEQISDAVLMTEFGSALKIVLSLTD
jgi:HPt (histidine-containing phosphotransfer) domain-containing protein